MNTVVTAQNPNGATMQLFQPQTQGEADDQRRVTTLDSYFVEQPAPSTSAITPLSTTAVAITANPLPSPAAIVAKLVFFFSVGTFSQ